MEPAPPTDISRGPRADAVLTLAIVMVCVLVLGVAIMLVHGRALHQQEEAVVQNVRAARAEMIAMTQAQGDAETLALRFVTTRRQPLLQEYSRAKIDGRAHLTALRQIVVNDPELTASVARLEALMEQRIGVLDADVAGRRWRNGDERSDGLHASFREESARFHALANGRIDIARAAEDASRLRLDWMGLALALLTIVASLLAIFVLRREREQWRLAQDATEKSRAIAAAADHAKSRFLAVASHDMRQPLHAISLYLSALERRVDNPEARDILDKMERATRSMTGMFSSLLDLARVQAGVVTPEIEVFALQDVFDRLVAEHPSGNVRAEPTHLHIRSDEALIERALRNLITNAIKHGGGKAQLTALVDGSEVELRVSDRGPGIAEEDQVRMFDEFVRLNPHGVEGLGLGLSIVQRICVLLELPLRVESKPGQGAVFIIRAPRAAATNAPHALDATPAQLNGAPVLVMDDDALAREAIAGALSDLGADVRRASDEASVLETLDTGFTPRLLVMDLRINGALDGIDISHRVRAHLGQLTPVIMVTGDTGPETLEKLRASGFSWLIKPVDILKLSQAVAKQLNAD